MKVKIPYRDHGKLYNQYFKNQVGGKNTYFDGLLRQDGYGLGNYLGSLARIALPLLGKVFKEHGPKIVSHIVREAIKTPRLPSETKNRVERKRKLEKVKQKQIVRKPGGTAIKRKKYRHKDIFN